MARLILSAGMFSAFAAAMAVRRRGLVSGSPPFLAAIEISLIRRVKILPRLASSAPFLCLIVAHFEWPDMDIPSPSLNFYEPGSRRIALIRDQDSPVRDGQSDASFALEPSRRTQLIARLILHPLHKSGICVCAIMPSSEKL